MLSLLSSILMVIRDVKEEIISSSPKYIFVSSESEILVRLKELNVDPSTVKFVDTKLPVTDWKKVGGIFKVKDEIYAYSSDIKSELAANLQSI